METKVAQHTPGPWIVYGGHDGQFKHEPLILHQLSGQAGLELGPDIAIAQIRDQGNQRITDKNAALIAQAPTLLAQRDALAEALEGLLASSNALAKAAPTALAGQTDAAQLHHADVEARAQANAVLEEIRRA